MKNEQLKYNKDLKARLYMHKGFTDQFGKFWRDGTERDHAKSRYKEQREETHDDADQDLTKDLALFDTLDTE